MAPQLASQLRVLVCSPCGSSEEDDVSLQLGSAIGHLRGLPDSRCQVTVLHRPTKDGLRTALAETDANVLYWFGRLQGAKNTGLLGKLELADGCPSTRDVATLLTGTQLQIAYLDAASEPDYGDMLHAKGVPATVHWPSPPPTLPAAQFAHTFFAALHNPTVTPAEAFALASHVTNAHCTTWGEGRHVPPPLPVLLAPDGQRPQLPDNSSVPPPVADGMDFSQGVAAAVPGWADVRLLAPRAELPLRLCGGQPLIDSHRLSFLGEALRALLVMELRQLTLVDVQPCGRPAASSHLPPSCQEGVRCELRTASGATTAVVLAGVSGVLQLRPLVEHALRQTLVSDSLSLQFRLSPPGILLPPVPQVLPDVACSAPVIEAMVLTSLWAVHVLRLLAQDASFKGLMALGVAAVSSAPVAAASHVDAQRMHMIATGLGPETLGQGFYGGPDGARAAAAAALVSAMDGAEGVETGTAGLTTSCGEEIELPSELPEDGGPLMMAAAAAPLADGPSASGSVPLPPGARASEAPAPGLLTQEDNSSAMAAATPAPADRGVGRGIEPAAPPAAGGGSTAGG